MFGKDEFFVRIFSWDLWYNDDKSLSYVYKREDNMRARIIRGHFAKLAAAVAVLAGAGTLPCAGTDIPSGYAEYEITVDFTAFPDLDLYGDWPIQMNLRMNAANGCDIRGQRVSYRVDENGHATQAVYRAIANLARRWDYVQSDAYSAASGQSLALLPFACSANTGIGGDTQGAWATGQGVKSKWTEKTVESFSAGVSNMYAAAVWGSLSRTPAKMSVATSNTGPDGTAGSGMVSTFQSIAFKRVKKLKIDDVASGARLKYDFSVRFSHPLSQKGFASVSNITIAYTGLFTISLDNPSVSEDGLTYTALFTGDVADMIAQINASDYRNSTVAKSTLTVTGTDAEGNAAKYSFDSWSGLLAEVSEGNEIALSESLWDKFHYRPVSGFCRLTDLGLLRRTSNMGMTIIVR